MSIAISNHIKADIVNSLSNIIYFCLLILLYDYNISINILNYTVAKAAKICK